LTPELGWYWFNLVDGKEGQLELAKSETTERWALNKPDEIWSVNSKKKRKIDSSVELKKEPSKSGDFRVSLTLWFTFQDEEK
jgi:hypothetical protein